MHLPMTTLLTDRKTLLYKIYDYINARDIDAALEHMHPDVSWANGMEGGFALGHEEIRQYWQRQWEYIDPHLQPIQCDTTEPGQVVVEVHQIIRDLLGNIISIKNVQHVFWFEDGRIRAMRVNPTTA
jgi:ketosteroid isomerase-like protein